MFYPSQSQLQRVQQPHLATHGTFTQFPRPAVLAQDNPYRMPRRAPDGSIPPAVPLGQHPQAYGLPHPMSAPIPSGPMSQIRPMAGPLMPAAPSSPLVSPGHYDHGYPEPASLFPIGGTARARNDLADAFAEISLEAQMLNLVGLRVLPLLEVGLAHGTYPTIPVKELMRRPLIEEATPAGNAYRRAPNGSYAEDEFGFTEASYTTQEHGIVGKLDRSLSNHYRTHFDHELAMTLFTRHRLMIQHELRVATAVFDTTRFTGSLTHVAGAVANPGPNTATPWSDSANADPIADVWHAKHNVWLNTGVTPDAMVINERAWRHLRIVDDIQNQIQAGGTPEGRATQQPRVTEERVAEVLDLDELIVAAATEDANNANAATFQAQHVWGASANVFKKARRMTIDEIALGHTMHWAEDGSMPNGFVETYFDDDHRCWKVRVRHQTRELIKYNAGYLITTVY